MRFQEMRDVDVIFLQRLGWYSCPIMLLFMKWPSHSGQCVVRYFGFLGE